MLSIAKSLESFKTGLKETTTDIQSQKSTDSDKSDGQQETDENGNYTKSDLSLSDEDDDNLKFFDIDDDIEANMTIQETIMLDWMFYSFCFCI